MISILTKKLNITSHHELQRAIAHCIYTNTNVLLNISYDTPKHFLIRKTYQDIHRLKKLSGSTAVIFIVFCDVEGDRRGFVEVKIEDLCKGSENKCECVRSSVEQGKIVVNREKDIIFQEEHSTWLDAYPHNKISYKSIVLGGTFDRIHEGHFLLLSTSLLLASVEITIGLTTQRLHTSKKYKEKIEKYEYREEKIIYFCRLFKEIVVTVLPLQDHIGPADRGDYGCMVVSEETYGAGEKINQIREEKGYKKYDIVVTPLIQYEREKLSSSDLREEQ